MAVRHSVPRQNNIPTGHMTETVEILMILGTAYQEISGQQGYAIVVFRDDELRFIKPDGSIHKLGPTTWSEMTGKPPLPILDSEGKLAPHYLPSLHVSNTFRVDSEEELLTLDADSGDLAVDSAAQKAWILVGDAAVAGDWVELQYFPVASVAGKTGNVVLVVSDIEGLPEQIASILAGIASINEELADIGGQLADKADTTALNDVAEQLTDKVTRAEFTALQGVVSEKIGADDYDLLVAAINARAEQSELDDALALIAQKASQSSLETLSASVASKAEQAALTALSGVVAGKAPISHTHDVEDILGLSSELSAKADLVDGKIPAVQLPSFVDDVIEYWDITFFPAVGETGKIYISLDENRVYRWGGVSYIEIVASPGSTDAVPEGPVNKYYTDARAALKADVNHTHEISDVAGLPDALADKAQTTHDHPISSIVNLPAELDKANTGMVRRMNSPGQTVQFNCALGGGVAYSVGWPGYTVAFTNLASLALGVTKHFYCIHPTWSAGSNVQPITISSSGMSSPYFRINQATWNLAGPYQVLRIAITRLEVESGLNFYHVFADLV